MKTHGVLKDSQMPVGDQKLDAPGNFGVFDQSEYFSIFGSHRYLVHINLSSPIVKLNIIN